MRTALVAIVAVLLAGCNGDDAPPPAQVPLSSLWSISYSPGMPPGMAFDEASYSFDFPAAPGSVHYVTHAAPVGRSVIHMRFRIEGAGTLIPTQGAPPAKVRLFLQRRGDTLSRDSAYEHFRFWSAPTDLTVAGDFTVEYNLDPALWTSVYGQTNAEGFAACLADLESVGFTFGGEFAGHGVLVSSGSFRFILVSYEVY